MQEAALKIEISKSRTRVAVGVRQEQIVSAAYMADLKKCLNRVSEQFSGSRVENLPLAPIASINFDSKQSDALLQALFQAMHDALAREGYAVK